MQTYRLILPDGAAVIGELMVDIEPRAAWDQDELQVILPNGYGIDVGCYGGPEDEFELTVVAFRNEDFNKQVGRWVVPTPLEAKHIVETFCGIFALAEEIQEPL